MKWTSTKDNKNKSSQITKELFSTPFEYIPLDEHREHRITVSCIKVSSERASTWERNLNEKFKLIGRPSFSERLHHKIDFKG